MGYSDLGSYGSEIETPNLDRLVDNGMRFTSFYKDSSYSKAANQQTKIAWPSWVASYLFT